MNRSANSTLPSATPIGEALAQAAPLVQLQALVRASNALYAQVAPLLPPALAAQVRPGPLGDEGWTLLAANTAVAAKLRQWLPRLESAVGALRPQGSRIRIHVQSN